MITLNIAMFCNFFLNCNIQKLIYKVIYRVMILLLFAKDEKSPCHESAILMNVLVNFSQIEFRTIKVSKVREQGFIIVRVFLTAN